MMVTWTFDLCALFIGLMIGMVVGATCVAFIFLLDGGLWSKGFDEGCNLEHAIESMNDLVERAKE